ncbi:MAG: hypothetical protein LQ347_001001 [Umbilicaria vellea]|nr:MAG: hypothetical protein LQ347_001001 [Umbilicaria vellea]
MLSTLTFLLRLEFGGTVYPRKLRNIDLSYCIRSRHYHGLRYIERYFARYPLVAVHLYANVSNSAVFVVDPVSWDPFDQNTYFIPLYYQSALGVEPLLSGLLLLPFNVSKSVATVDTGIYLKKKGLYLDCIRFGFVMLVLGLGLFCNLLDSTTWLKIHFYQMIAGFGVGLNLQPPLIALQSNVPAQDNAAATASFGLVRNVGSAIGVVIGSVALANRMDVQEDMLIDVLGVLTANLFYDSNE